MVYKKKVKNNNKKKRQENKKCQLSGVFNSLRKSMARWESIIMRSLRILGRS